MHIDSSSQDCYSLTFFDLLESYYQANNLKLETNNSFYLIDHITEDRPPGFDYYFVENAGHPLQVMGNAKKFIDQGSADLLIGSFLHANHELYNRTLSFPEDFVNCNTWYTNPNYFTSNLFKTKQKKHNLTFITGKNRSVRQYLTEELSKHCNVVIDKDTNIVKTQCNSFASDEDNYFVNYCNDRYNAVSAKLADTSKKHELEQVIRFGKDGKFGKSTLGYCPLEEYFTSKCIVYPETTFYNWELLITEKTWKCIKANTHWIMFSGAGSYEIMRELGFRSIVELCPDRINNFDSETDHICRIQKIAECCNYLQTMDSLNIFDSSEAQNILKNNYENFHNPAKIIERAVKPFKRYL